MRILTTPPPERQTLWQRFRAWLRSFAPPPDWDPHPLADYRDPSEDLR